MGLRLLEGGKGIKDTLLLFPAPSKKQKNTFAFNEGAVCFVPDVPEVLASTAITTGTASVMGTVATVSVSMVSTILSVVTACVSRSRCTTLTVLSIVLTVLSVTLSWGEHFRMVLLVLLCTFHAVAADGIPEASGLIV